MDSLIEGAIESMKFNGFPTHYTIVKSEKDKRWYAVLFSPEDLIISYSVDSENRRLFAKVEALYPNKVVRIKIAKRPIITDYESIKTVLEKEKK